MSKNLVVGFGFIINYRRMLINNTMYAYKVGSLAKLKYFEVYITKKVSNKFFFNLDFRFL